MAGRQPDPGQLERDPRGVGLQRARLRPVREDDGEDLHAATSSPTARSIDVIDEICKARPAHVRAGDRRGDHVDGRSRSRSGSSPRSGRASSPTASSRSSRSIGISMPVFWIGALMNYYLGLQVGALPQRRLRAVHRGPVGVVLPPDHAVDRAVDPVHRRLLARAALEHPRHDERGLRAHRAGEGARPSARCCSSTCCATR